MQDTLKTLKNTQTSQESPGACVILIGNEILSGRTQDKNLTYIAKGLLTVGIKVHECRIIPDMEDIIIQTLNQCRSQYDYVFTTGGIGPTHDDLTTASVAKAFNVPLIRHENAVKKIKNRMKSNLNQASLKMADIPEGAALIHNPVTAAPGFVMENVYVMAGIPPIMQGMLDSVLPTLTGGELLHSQSIFCDLSESRLAPGLHKIQQTYPDLEIGSYPHWPFTDYRLSLVTRGTSKQLVEKACEEIQTLILSLEGTILVQPED